VIDLDYSHTAMLVFVQNYAADEAERLVAGFRATLPFELVNCVQGPFRAPFNGGAASYVFLPENAKRYGGWSGDQHWAPMAARCRHEFVVLFERLREDDGSTPATVVSVHFGPNPQTGEPTAPKAWQQ